jgi:uncharacterized protein YkwD
MVEADHPEGLLLSRHLFTKKTIVAVAAAATLVGSGTSSAAISTLDISEAVSTVTALAGAGSSSGSAATSVPSNWLSVVNYYRAMAGLPAVTERAALSDNDRKHAKYMVENQVIGHSEDPGLAFYTPGGDNAAQHSNLTRGSYSMSDRAAVESWMMGPFHAIGILDPRLKKVGYGTFRERGHDPSFEFAAALDVLNGLESAPVGLAYPVRFPGPNQTTFLSEYRGGENPDPLSPCAGYSAPTGAPIMLQLKLPAPVVAHSFKMAGGPELDSCIYDSTTYTNPTFSIQQNARAVLGARNAIVLVPRSPLKSGKTYDVSITHGLTTTAWSFKVGDVVAPITKISAPSHGGQYDRDDLRNLTGSSAADTARVEVAVAKYLTNGSCKFWNGSTFVKRRCSSRVWLKASGASNWSYRLSSKLAPTVGGSSIANYLMWSRARDKSGNVERNFKPGRNYVGFNITD